MTTKPNLEVVHTELDLLADEISARQSTAKPEDLARLSAESVQATYTAMAKNIESLKTPVIDRTKKMEAALAGLNAAFKMIDEFTAKIVDTGHHHAAQIDEANALAAEVQKMIADYIAKVK
jgi:hypothetical protein